MGLSQIVVGLFGAYFAKSPFRYSSDLPLSQKAFEGELVGCAGSVGLAGYFHHDVVVFGREEGVDGLV